VQGNGPRVSRLRANGVRAVQEQCAGDATGRGDPAGGYADVPTVFQWHTHVSSGSLAHEQENPEVRRGVGIANQSGSIVCSHEFTTSSSSYSSLIAPPTTATTGYREEYSSGHPPPITIPWQAFSSPMESRHCRALLVANPVHRGNSLFAHSSPQPRLPQGLS
jgi:hypothetical protein